jgi:cytochrome c oxidase cbb3-type subunit 2
MNRGPWIFLGAFFTLAVSFWGLGLAPQLQIGRQDVVPLAATGELYPAARTGLALAGEDVYRSLGCADCHTRQVRARGFGTDFARGWGLRFSVAQDYLRDYPVQLGSLRIGPDLANIGLRQTNTVWHYIHLYNPALTAAGSLMPRYPFLFARHTLARGQAPSPESLPVTPSNAGYEVLPKDDARNLVAYLLSLQASAPLFESPLPPAPKDTAALNVVPGTATNISGASATNAGNLAGTNPPGSAATNAPDTNTAAPAK